jgi:Cu2+-exporting ATPase
VTTCAHCNQDMPDGEASSELQFCCSGCEGAYHIIKGLGLGSYYQRRILDPDTAPLIPEDDEAGIDYTAQIIEEKDGELALHLMVEGMHCAACVWLIETVLQRQPGVTHARLNMSTRRLILKWQGDKSDATPLVGAVNVLGYRLVPYDPQMLNQVNERQEKELLRAMAVAGFAASNVMLLSVSVWAGHFQDMQGSTRDLMHWLSALVALPAVAYAGRPFFRSALSALAAKRVNMDVPISLAVLLASGMSLYEVMRSAEHTYFDSAITLLFFLLIGRYLDRRARGRAQSAAERLLALNARAATVLDEDGGKRLVPPSEIKPGMILLVAPGERISADGVIVEGVSDIDTSFITGESLPMMAKPEQAVYAGSNNLSAALRVKVTASDKDTLLAEIVRLMENAEQGRAAYVALADRVARLYAPVVHGLAAITFLGWFLIGNAPWQDSLLTAIAVLIVTCPCALALAVPVVQVLASGRLLRRGIFVKSATALERLAKIDTVVFDKTGTLTMGKPELVNHAGISEEDLSLAASLAGASKHPLARALTRAVQQVPVKAEVSETPGMGLEWNGHRLGNRAWCGVAEPGGGDEPEIWLRKPTGSPVRFVFRDQVKADAHRVVVHLKRSGKKIELLSGDRESVVKAIACELGINLYHAAQTPAEKVARLEALSASGEKVLMVGDGLNDAPALAAAHASLSPTTAADVSQTAADMVFQGTRLAPVLEALETAIKADELVKQNFALAFFYNAVTIPLAVTGYVTPLIAAIAMSASSLVVIGNALRLTLGQNRNG